MNEFEIRAITEADRQRIAAFVATRWGSPMSVSRGRMVDVRELPGFVCGEGEKIIGLVTYRIENTDCEIATLNSLDNNRGLATQLINKVIAAARFNGCKRIWLITTNDNAHAIRFYQRRGFEWVGFYKDAMETSRKLKPQIPMTGNDGIPIRHEIEFEYRL